ncbi:MAG: GGDEF domain-containing protein [Planctomycetes bacterium]|nr:GGDEF domain-containing protein [Planctomycetota bacterium]
MTRPGFRRGRPGGTTPKAAGDAGDGFLSSALFSQAQILHLMKNEFARARRYGVPLGCVLIQVDRLHQLVDLHGVELRNAVRAALAQLVRDKTRGADLLGASSDDRYLLILPHTDLAHTHLVATRLQQLFGELEIKVDGRELLLTVSIGVTACTDQTTLFFDTFVAQAEAALDYALHHGGNQVATFGAVQLRGGDHGPIGPDVVDAGDGDRDRDQAAPGGAGSEGSR